jgi:hypothetical protein
MTDPTLQLNNPVVYDLWRRLLVAYPALSLASISALALDAYVRLVEEGIVKPVA